MVVKPTHCSLRSASKNLLHNRIIKLFRRQFIKRLNDKYEDRKVLLKSLKKKKDNTKQNGFL